MIQLPDAVTHPELCDIIVGQFAFMKAMARPEDSNFFPLQELSLNDVFEKADAHFIDFTITEEVIDTKKCNLSEKIKLFLSEWSQVVDVTAIQQNIHYKLNQQ
jgi:hypothetical protein